MNKIVRVFLNTDMRAQHDGLFSIAKKEGVDLRVIEPGSHIIFVNRMMDRIKLYSSSGVLSYMRSAKGRLNLGMIEQIPKCFDAKGKVNWDEASRLALQKQLTLTNKELKQ